MNQSDTDEWIKANIAWIEYHEWRMNQILERAEIGLRAIGLGDYPEDEKKPAD